MKSIISNLIDQLEGKIQKPVPPTPMTKNYVSERLFASGVKSFDSRLKVQVCVARGGWRSIQVYVVIEGRKVVVLDSAEVHGSVHPHRPLGFEVPNVKHLTDALTNIIGSDPQKWTLAKETNTDPMSGVDVTEL